MLSASRVLEDCYDTDGDDENYNCGYKMNSPFQYNWQVPSMSPNSVLSLCHGFFRLYQSTFLNYHTFPDGLKSLIISYFGPQDSMSRIRNCKNGQFIQSPVFQIGNLKWFMKLYPNGNTPSNVGYASCHLCLASLSPQIERISAKFSILLNEKGFVSQRTKDFKLRSMHTVWHNFLSTADFCALQDLSFFLILQITQICKFKEKYLYVPPDFDNGNVRSSNPNALLHYDESENISNNSANISNLKMNFEAPIDRHIWKITDQETILKMKNAQNTQIFYSSVFRMHSLNWFLKFYPNGANNKWKGTTDLYLELIALPRKISRFCVHFNILLKETNTHWSTVRQYTQDKLSVGWPGTIANSLITNDLMDLKSFTFKVEIQLFDVFDENSQNVTHKFIGTEMFDQTNNNNDNDDDERKYELNNHNNGQWNANNGKYTWHISDDNMLRKMKFSQPAQAFLSDIFVVSLFKWNIKIYPHGFDYDDDHQNIAWCCQLASFTPLISQITYKVTIELCETNETVYAIQRRKITDLGYLWCSGQFTSNLNAIRGEITFKLQLEVMNIFDRNGDVFNGYKEMVSAPLSPVCSDPESYVWNIDNAEQLHMLKCDYERGEFVESETFVLNNLEWILTFYPNGKENKNVGVTQVFLHLKEMKGAARYVAVKFEISLSEVGAFYVGSTQFSSKNMVVGSPWKANKLTLEDIQILNKLTFKVVIALINIFDGDGNDITHEFVPKK